VGLNTFHSLLFDEITSDIHFVVQNEKIPAHRCIVASSSEGLKGILYGPSKEAREALVPFTDPRLSVPTFKEFLRYVYTGVCTLTPANVFGLRDLANMLEMIAAAELWSNEKLFADAGLCSSLTRVPYWPATPWFYSPRTFLMLVDDDQLTISEIDLFLAVAKWVNANPDAKRKPEILERIRYGCISSADLAKHVRPTKLAPPELYLLAFEYQACSEIQIPENFATPRGPKYLHESSFVSPAKRGYSVNGLVIVVEAHKLIFLKYFDLGRESRITKLKVFYKEGSHTHITSDLGWTLVSEGGCTDPIPINKVLAAGHHSFYISSEGCANGNSISGGIYIGRDLSPKGVPKLTASNAEVSVWYGCNVNSVTPFTAVNNLSTFPFVGSFAYSH
jgi:hypothetical protein